MPLSTIGTNQIADGAVAVADIADGSVTTAKIADNAVTTAKVDPAQTDITSVGTLTSFRSTGIDDNADAVAISIDSSERVMIGTTTEGVAGADELTVGNTSGGNGITIRSGTSNNGALYFSDGTSGASEYDGGFEYSHGSQFMRFISGGSERMRLDGSGLMINTSTAFNHLNGRGDIVVGDGSSNGGMTIFTGSSNQGSLVFADGTSGDQAYRGMIEYDHSADSMAFKTAVSERMRIASDGNVMIGITSSDHKFMVNQTTVNKIGGFFYNNTSTNSACLKVLQDGAGSSGPALLVRQDGSGNAITVDDGSDGNTVFSVSQNGALSKASGSFKIKHPLEAKKDTHYLVHSFVEAPQADNIYRGTATLSSGTATINLDTVSGMAEGTYVLLNTNTSCFTSNETDWDAVKGSVLGNKLTITCQNSSSTATVSWLVIGERHDQHMKDTDWTDDNGKVIVEPLKEGA